MLVKLKIFLIFSLIFSSVHPAMLMATEEGPLVIEPAEEETFLPVITEEEILSRSQISYRALGRDNGLHTYSVVISCVDGKVSTLKTVFRPGSGPDPEPIRQVGTLNKEAYLDLWKTIQEKHLFDQEESIEVASPSSSSIHLFASVGEDAFKFFSEDINSPQSSVFKTVHNAINKKVQMEALLGRASADTARR